MELKSFGMGAMSALALIFSACTANEELEDFNNTLTDSNEIGFRVLTSDPTRTAGSNSYSTAVSDFKVTALDEGKNYFGTSPINVFTRDNGNSWTTDNVRYWPLNRPDSWSGLTFVAYVDDACHGDSFRLTDGEASFSGYEVPADVRNQSDLMYAVAKDVRKDSFGGNADLHFRHALSQICFTAQNNNPAYENIEILSIEVGGVKGAGTYKFPTESTIADDSAYSRTASLSKGKWTIDGNAPVACYSLDNLGIGLGAADASCHGDKVSVSNTTSSGSSNVMYLMPQVAQALEDGEGAYIKVTTRMTLQGHPDNSFTSEEVIPISVNWKEGQRYTYNITWNAVPITFGVTISDFRDVSVTQD